ncbi:MAG: EAL domain-containing protein [Granulosicoccus sp.]|nr:EAL domain-containing protein [Granulosicoccus sp.]
MEKILLLVDDEPSILQSLLRVFRRTDFRVLTATNGEQALELIERLPVAVLVSDFNMPGLDGAELLSRARALRPEMSRVILSGNSDQDSVIRSINDGGALKFLTKPWDTDKLLSEVNSAFEIWLNQRYSLEVTGLLNGAAFVEEVQERLYASAGDSHVMINLQIRDIQAISQVMELQDDMELLRHYFQSRNLETDSESVVGLMEDGRICICRPLQEDLSNIQAQVQDLVLSLEGNLEHGENQFQICFDAGYAISDPALSAEELSRNALTALNQVVGSAGEHCVAFDSSMQDTAKKRLGIAEQLLTALPQKEFYLVYQPKIKTSSQTLHGAEALLRWKNRTLGQLSPLDFIPVAEESDLITEIGQWVLEDAAAQWHDWFGKHNTDARVSINVSPRQLWDKRFVERVSGVLDKLKVNPATVELEITESVMMQDVETAISVLHEIKSLGLKTSIDDFGTGYSSLNYLHRLPLDVLKIDRSFISPLLERKESQSLVKNLIILGQDLNMEIVAEGVENDAQLDLLLEMGCDVIQGYYYSPPVTVAEFSALMRTYPVLSTPDIRMLEKPLRKAS